MSKNQNRRSILSGLAASAFASLAGLFGGRARASDLKVIERAAGTLKPVEGSGFERVDYEYRYVIERLDIPEPPRNSGLQWLMWRNLTAPRIVGWYPWSEIVMAYASIVSQVEQHGGKVR